ncbi:uncharacterized protein K489DRAFT_322876 [Dissoconium aciculare CBS 342.82]|uniref:Uncharacterized protein n=1 Tax=Dissoconium aciculare CBS 342.82 TaxID=1314786 RepID=A0A6J3M304_9PEZI|nr:uncharacterized protein K489DRAFT_322876 [Dissoconium aciculare CBS 342.82]KAF1821322.1 hypothetical protein K489DRAFT_322876 [Dissoconium aciculare CBS 342.82]
MAEEIVHKLKQNIAAVIGDALQPLDRQLFDQAELIIPETISDEERKALIISLTTLLPTIQQDPAPATRLLEKLLATHSYREISALLGSASLVDGLAVGEHMIAFNGLILAILEKATTNYADAASVATPLETLLALIRLWLSTSDTGIASRASYILVDLLRVDLPTSQGGGSLEGAGGQGLVWKRIFGDRNVYATLFEACSLGKSSTLNLSKSQTTLAQARLMEWLPRVAKLDWNHISQSHHPDVESTFADGGSLLEFAALRMVDTKDDILMYRCLIDFYSELLLSTRSNHHDASSAVDSPGLLFLISHGLHMKTAAMYLQLPGTGPVDPVETMFLYGPAARYLATYASQYPAHFLASQMPAQVLQRLRTSLDLSPARWAHSETPLNDLHLLASLPRRALINDSIGANWSQNPLSFLPPKPTNPDVLNTLATIFHGPEDEVVFSLASPTSHLVPQSTSEKREEAINARALYYHYLAHNPNFHADLVSHAEVLALKDLALAAIHTISSIITATWPTQQEKHDSTPDLPTITTPSRTSPSTALATPPTGHEAILAPPALEHILPYLLKPAKTFANLVGGGRGDVESAAWQVAAAKFGAVEALAGRLRMEVTKRPGVGFEEILATVEKRIRDGVMTVEGEVGGRVAVMEL